MSDTQIETPDITPIPPVVLATVETDVEPQQPERRDPKPDKKREAPPAPPVNRELSAVTTAEDQSLRDMLLGLGTNGSFEVIVHRMEPEDVLDPATGRRIKTSGMLKRYTEALDEAFIKQKHGGGKYRVQVMRKTGKGEHKVHAFQRTFEIAGDPDLNDPCLTRMAPAPMPAAIAAPVAPVAAESEKLVARAMDSLEKQIDRLQDQKPAVADHKPYELMIQQLGEQNAMLREEIREMRRAAETRAAAPQNPVETKLVEKLLDQDGARIQALRTQHESEIRMLREQHADDLKRIHDRHDRMIDSLRSSFEREIASLKTSQDTIKLVQDVSASTTQKVLEGQVRALERELESKDKELSDLRNRKDKSMAEQIKEMNALKELMEGDGDADEGIVGQIAGKVPEIISAVGGMMGKGPQQQQQAPQQALPQAPQRPALVKGPDGKRYRLHGNQWVEVKPKPQMVQGAEGTQPVQVPQIAPERLEMIKSLLEKAFENGQEPDVAAQTAKAALAGQEDLLIAIRQMGGVDEFLRKVANLRSDSPLLTQAGKNWLRKFSKSLVGE